MAGAFTNILLLLLLLVAVAQLGLTAFLISYFDEKGWPGQRQSGPLVVKAFIFTFVIDSAWTVLGAVLFISFGETNALFTGRTCLGWLAVTIPLWLIPTVIFNVIREGGLCINEPTVSLCREFMAVEALGWTALILSVLALAAAWFRVRRARRRYAYAPSTYSHSTYPTSYVAPRGSGYAQSSTRSYVV